MVAPQTKKLPRKEAFGCGATGTYFLQYTEKASENATLGYY